VTDKIKQRKYWWGNMFYYKLIKKLYLKNITIEGISPLLKLIYKYIVKYSMLMNIWIKLKLKLKKYYE